MSATAKLELEGSHEPSLSRPWQVFEKLPNVLTIAISSSGFDVQAGLQTPHDVGQCCRTMVAKELSGMQRPCAFAAAQDCGPCLLNARRTPTSLSGAESHPVVVVDVEDVVSVSVSVAVVDVAVVDEMVVEEVVVVVVEIAAMVGATVVGARVVSGSVYPDPLLPLPLYGAIVEGAVDASWVSVGVDDIVVVIGFAVVVVVVVVVGFSLVDVIVVVGSSVVVVTHFVHVEVYVLSEPGVRMHSSQSDSSQLQPV